MLNQFSRTELLYGKEAVEALSQKRVAIFGIGGVGGYVCESLVRSGIGHFDLIDNDTVCLTNLNRQIIATLDTVGKFKVDVMKERMLSINPEADIRVYKCFFLPENASDFPFETYDYVVDAIDTVTAKIEIIMRCKEVGIPVISAMGAGNKLDPSRFVVTDIYKTTMCPLAKVMRHEMKKRGVKKLKVVYSDEKPVSADAKALAEYEEEELSGDVEHKSQGRRSIPGSTAFAPAVAGLILASEVMKDLTEPYMKENESYD